GHDFLLPSSSSSICQFDHLHKILYTLDQTQGLRLSLQKKTLKPEVREALEEDLAKLLMNKRLLEEKKNPKQKLQQIKVLRGYNQLVEACAEHWDKLSIEGRIALIDALTDKVLLDRV